MLAVAPEDGVAQVALGLGKSVVEGYEALRFCPRVPEILPQFSAVKDILRNAQRRLNSLERDAKRYKPYSSDPNAETIDPSLVADIKETEDSIQRHEINLGKFRDEEKKIRERFQGDIERFKRIKGIDDETGLAVGAGESSTSVAQIVPE